MDLTPEQVIEKVSLQRYLVEQVYDDYVLWASGLGFKAWWGLWLWGEKANGNK